MEKYVNITPKMEYIPSYNPKPETGWQGVQALWYEGATYKGRPTKVFAYIGFPDVSEDEKVPAIVLVHGGGGHAYAEWVKQWNKRGFAAIAMDTEGYFPAESVKGLTGIEDGPNEKYTRELSGEVYDPEYILGPGNDHMGCCSLPLEEQWMYHGVAATILAHNILRADPRIDNHKIGICGISWGGIMTSLAIGYDTRYAFAIPIYGCAYMDSYYTTSIVSIMFHLEGVKKNWNAADRLSNAKFPILWLNGLQDRHFCSIMSSHSYLATKKHGAVLSVKDGFLHGHVYGWEAEESYRFAQCVVMGKKPFIYPVTEPASFDKEQIEVWVPEDFENIKVRMVYFKEPFYYKQNCELGDMLNVCYSKEVEFDGSAISAEIPTDAYSYYFEFAADVDGKTVISTTALAVREN